MIKKEHILNEIRRTARENGDQPLGQGRFENETGIKRTDWLGKYWSKWGYALIEAGFKPNEIQGAFDEELLIKKLISLIRENKKFPTKYEIKLKSFNDKEFPSETTFINRFGKKHQMAKIIFDYCESETYFRK